MENNISVKENQMHFVFRFYQYQKERFPLMVHGLLIACFTFSAIAYSRLSRGMSGFISWADYGFAACMTVGLFFLLRLFDEVKDYEDDVKFRPYLPVARGLIRLSEIHIMTGVVILCQVMVLVLMKPMLLPIYGLCLGYMILMRIEFFVPDWLRKHQVWYILSHMLIIPLIDILASAFDWKLSGALAPTGLAFFFVVSFLNGLVLEIGRKMRARDTEEEGVISYTSLWGIHKACLAWVALLSMTLITALLAADYASHPSIFFYLLGLAYVLCLCPIILFYKNPNAKTSKWVEHASGLWTLAMYLLLGGAPFLIH